MDSKRISFVAIVMWLSTIVLKISWNVFLISSPYWFGYLFYIKTNDKDLKYPNYLTGRSSYLISMKWTG
jgi:hypothetical protein